MALLSPAVFSSSVVSWPPQLKGSQSSKASSRQVPVAVSMSLSENTRGMAARSCTGGNLKMTSSQGALLRRGLLLSTLAIPFIKTEDAKSIPFIQDLQSQADSERQRYEALDNLARSSPLVEELKRKSEENREKNKKALEAKYCRRGAEMGVGDCSMRGFTLEEQEEFINYLKKAERGEVN